MECEICVKPYDKSKRQPFVVSPCSHTFCIECLQKLDLKQCRTCNKEIRGKNTNWALLQLVPESNFDTLKAKVQNTFEQAESSRQNFEELRQNHFEENFKRIKMFKHEIKVQRELIDELLHNHYQSINLEVDVLEEEESKKRMEIVEQEDNLKQQLIQAKQDIDSNNLDESELLKLNDELASIHLNMNKCISEKDKWHDYMFVNNKNVFLENNLIGKIEQK